MDSWPSSREVERPKPLKQQAHEEADFLKALEASVDPQTDAILLSRRRVRNLVDLLRKLGGAPRG